LKEIKERDIINKLGHSKVKIFGIEVNRRESI